MSANTQEEVETPKNTTHCEQWATEEISRSDLFYFSFYEIENLKIAALTKLWKREVTIPAWSSFQTISHLKGKKGLTNKTTVINTREVPSPK